MSYKNLTKEQLEEIFHYDILSGVLYRKRTGKAIEFNQFDTVPKVSFKIGSENYRTHAHSVIWVLCYGHWSEKIIFHKDFNQFNLKITNLMQVDNRTNYALLSAYRNLMQYCDIKIHNKYTDIYLVRYLCNGKLKYEKYEDISFAKRSVNRLRLSYKRLIVKLGGIPPK